MLSQQAPPRCQQCQQYHASGVSPHLQPCPWRFCRPLGQERGRKCPGNAGSSWAGWQFLELCDEGLYRVHEAPGETRRMRSRAPRPMLPAPPDGLQACRAHNLLLAVRHAHLRSRSHFGCCPCFTRAAKRGRRRSTRSGLFAVTAFGQVGGSLPHRHDRKQNAARGTQPCRDALGVSAGPNRRRTCRSTPEGRDRRLMPPPPDAGVDAASSPSCGRACGSSATHTAPPAPSAPYALHSSTCAQPRDALHRASRCQLHLSPTPANHPVSKLCMAMFHSLTIAPDAITATHLMDPSATIRL